MINPRILTITETDNRIEVDSVYVNDNAYYDKSLITSKIPID